MRLSEIKGPRCVSIMADVVELAGTILKNKAVVALIEGSTVPQGENRYLWFVNLVADNVPTLIRECGDDIIALLATIEDKTTDEYLEDATIPKIVSDIMDVLNDEELLPFLS